MSQNQKVEIHTANKQNEDAFEDIYIQARDALLTTLLRRKRIGNVYYEAHSIGKFPFFRNLSRVSKKKVLKRMLEEDWLRHFPERDGYSLNSTMVEAAQAILTAEQLAPSEEDDRDFEPLPAEDEAKVDEEAREAIEQLREQLRRQAEAMDRVKKEQHPTVVPQQPGLSEADLKLIRELGQKVDSFNGRLSTLKEDVANLRALRGSGSAKALTERAAQDEALAKLQQQVTNLELVVAGVARASALAESAIRTMRSDEEMRSLEFVSDEVTTHLTRYLVTTKTASSIMDLVLGAAYRPHECFVCATNLMSATSAQGARTVPVVTKQEGEYYAPYWVHVCQKHEKYCVLDMAELSDADVAEVGKNFELRDGKPFKVTPEKMIMLRVAGLKTQGSRMLVEELLNRTRGVPQ